jgi:hypothetical protein
MLNILCFRIDLDLKAYLVSSRRLPWYDMDLMTDFRKAVDILRSNLILFLPALIIFYLVPVVLLVVAVYVFVPIVIVAFQNQSPISALLQGSLVGITAVVVLAILAYLYVISGAANMNRKAVLTGSTSMSDFWEGCRKYFGKICGGVLLLGVVYGVIIAVGMILTVAMILPGIPKVSSPEAVPSPLVGTYEPEKLTNLMNWLIEIFRMLSVPLGVWLALFTLSGILFLFTLFWVQALVVEDFGVFRAIGASIRFVQHNFKTTLGIVSLWIIAQGFTSAIFPGGGMGGGGLGYGYGFAFPAPLQAIFHLLVATFFTLLLYTVYMDRVGKI